jgi:hypothetical protein
VIWLLRRLAERSPTVEVDAPLEVDADAG